METKLVASSGGINWCWYHWFTIDQDKRTAIEIKSERFHRYNPAQGAGNHPDTAWSVEFLRKGGCSPEYWRQLTRSLPPCEEVVCLRQGSLPPIYYAQLEI